MVFTAEGRMSFGELAVWLPTQVVRGGEMDARLLVRADIRVSAEDVMKISDLATKSGFTGVQLALEDTQNSSFGSP
jgi:biopolymer transport protein ExbD